MLVKFLADDFAPQLMTSRIVTKDTRQIKIHDTRVAGNRDCNHNHTENKNIDACCLAQDVLQLSVEEVLRQPNTFKLDDAQV